MRHGDTKEGEGGLKIQIREKGHKDTSMYVGRRHEDTNIEEGLSTAIARVALCTVALFRKGCNKIHNLVTMSFINIILSIVL